MSTHIQHPSTAVKYSGVCVVIAAVMVAVCLTVPILAQHSGTQPVSGEGILLLRNGNTIQGKITQTGDGYDVVVEGGHVRVKAGDVESYCRTLEEGYRRKRGLIQPGDVREHLELAQWCQRHGLLGFAAQELAEAKALAPTHPLIPLVERRIQMSLYQPDRAERPVEPAVRSASADELDRVVRELPPGAVETFAHAIQPLLVNNCSTGECHGPQSESGFRLLRIPSGKAPSRRLTQRNLHSTLAWIDREDPAASKLLSEPIRPHGSATAAIFTDQQADQYQRVVDWVYRVSQKNEPATTVSREAEQKLPGQKTPPWLAMPAAHAPPIESAGDDSPDGGLEASVPEPSAPNGPPDSGPTGPPTGGVPGVPGFTIPPRGALPDFVPADPFDPEIFNRRFFPAKRP